MIRDDRRATTIAAALSCVAGYIDASGLIGTGGVFVSFMSGNSTRLSVATVEGDRAFAVVLVSVVLLFVAGVILGMCVSRKAGDATPRKVLLAVGGLLLGAAILQSSHQMPLGTAMTVLAMGAMNAVYHRDGEVSIGLTYVTGSLVKLGQHLTKAMFGGSKTAWIPFALLWVGLVCGAALGTWAQMSLQQYSLWPAVAAIFLLGPFATAVTPGA